MFIPDPDLDFLPLADPGVPAPDLGPRICNTARLPYIEAGLVLLPRGSVSCVRWGKAGVSAGWEVRKSMVLGTILNRQGQY
jgi:hypothetical protein